MNCDLCSTRRQSDLITAREGCKHKICRPCITAILNRRVINSEAAAASWILCPVLDCYFGKFDAEFSHDAVITPEKGSPRSSKGSPSSSLRDGDGDGPLPDMVKSIEFDENEYAVLCDRYLYERCKGKSLLRTAAYQDIRKRVDALLQDDNHFEVFKLLSELRDYEMNPRQRRLPLFRGKSSLENGVDFVDLTKADKREVFVVDSGSESEVPTAKSRERHIKSEHGLLESKKKITPHFNSNNAIEQGLNDDNRTLLAADSNVKAEPVTSVGQKRIFDKLTKEDDDSSVEILSCTNKMPKCKIETKSSHPMLKSNIKVKVESVLSTDNKQFMNQLTDGDEDSSVEIVSRINATSIKREDNKGDEDDSDEGSRFSIGGNRSESGDEEIKNEDDHSRNMEENISIFGDSDYDDHCDSDSNDGNQSTSNNMNMSGSLQTEVTQDEIDEAKKVKARKERAKLRKYGDRVLLARQSKSGMIKLGGNRQDTRMWPRDPDKRTARFDGRYCMALNDSWNPDGPKWAGQLKAAISHSPPENAMPHENPFSIFMKRTFVRNQGQPKLLGWEYCGEYILTGNNDISMYSTPSCETDRHYIATNIKHSLRTPNGWWHDHIDWYREQIERILEYTPESNDAIKLRELGLDNQNLTMEEIADRLVNWEGFHQSNPVQFVSYDEDMYSFVQPGETTRNSSGIKKKDGEPCAKASDWYAKLDTMVGL